MGVRIDTAIRLLEVDKDGLPEQAGEHGADNAAGRGDESPTALLSAGGIEVRTDDLGQHHTLGDDIEDLGVKARETPTCEHEGDGKGGADAITSEPATNADGGTAEGAIDQVRTGRMTVPEVAKAKRGSGVTTGVIGAAGPSDSDAEDSPRNSAGEGESATSGDNDLGDEDERPQLSFIVKPPEDFDWRKLKPRRYGKCLPPLDPSERQTLKAAIVSRGFLGRILIDDLLNIIDGNHRWTICMETGIAPVVEQIQGLSEDKEQRELEKEELALSCNLDRRQLDKEDLAKVFEARLDNLLKLQQENAKQWTLKKIAETLGVSIATVAARRDLRLNSDGGTVSKPDARRKYDDERKREAVRLLKEGTAKADVARQLCMSVKAVERAEKDEKEREAGGDATKGGKRKKAAAAKPLEPIEDISASDGVPEPHRRAIESLGQDTQAYVERFKARAAETRKEVEAISDIDEMQNVSLLYSLGLAFASLRLGKMLPGGEGVDVEKVAPPGDSRPDRAGKKPDTILLGTVIADELDEVCVALPVGGGGVIDKRNGRLDIYGPPKVDEVVRVRVEDFDWKRGLWKLQPLARQTVAPAPGAIAGSHRDDRFSPDTKLADRKAGPKEKRDAE